jgi:hypothetical protein
MLAAAKFDPSELEHPSLRRLHAYWAAQARAAGRRFPRRSDIDPIDFAYLLGQVALVEVTGPPLRFRWRLVGTWWREKFGIEATGMWADEWPHPEQRKRALRGYTRVVETAAPVRGVNSNWIDDARMFYELLLLPLSENDADVSMIVVALIEKKPA